ncbi:MAG TPA: sporulation protein YqfD [Firmicutes bacterium]|nr:sporulation protein YqfD [Bacillota bacterium]
MRALAASTFWRRIEGYAIIALSGGRPEELLNALLARRRYLAHVERVSPDLLLIQSSPADAGLVRELARERGLRMVVLKEGGLPFFFRRLAPRVSFVVGAALALGIMALVTRHIWFIAVQGVPAGLATRVRVALEELGIEPGLRRRQIDPDRLAEQLLLRVPQLAWVGVRTRGTLLEIRAVERIVPEALGYGPADLVARKDGLVTETLVVRGIPRVERGQPVTRGEVLIAGVEDGKPVRAEGIIRGRVWYEAEAIVPLEERLRERTGRVTRHRGIQVGRWRIMVPVPSRPSGAGSWEEEVKIRPGYIGTIRLPWAGITVCRFEVREQVIRRSEAEAVQEALARAWARVREQLPPGVPVVETSEDTGVSGDDGKGRSARARVLVSTSEELGTYRLRLEKPDKGMAAG